MRTPGADPAHAPAAAHPPRALVLVAHGSRDPRAEVTVRELAARVCARLPGVPVRAAFLDHTAPTPLAVLLDLAAQGVRDVRLVPLLFAPGFHVRTDLPEVIGQAQAAAPELAVDVSPTLAEAADDRGGGEELLLDALDRRFATTGARPAGLVLAAAGSSDPSARQVVRELAERWGARHRLPAAVSFASGPGARPAAAVTALCAERGMPPDRVGVGLLFLADGFLPGRAAADARGRGASVGPVLGPAPELAELVLRRFRHPSLAASGHCAPRA